MDINIINEILTFMPYRLQTFITREERHYCAYLFKWLLEGRGNVEEFLPKDIQLGSNVRLFYEYCPLREYLFSQIKEPDYLELKNDINRTFNENVDPKKNGKPWDIQKKKIDLAIQSDMDGKTTVYLIEAKFEEGFDETQLELTKNYGRILEQHFKINWEVILLGREYFLKKWEAYHRISWEDIVSRIEDNIVHDEIMRGLNYQKLIHPRT